MKADTNRTGRPFHQQNIVLYTMNYSVSKKDQWEQKKVLRKKKKSLMVVGIDV